MKKHKKPLPEYEIWLEIENYNHRLFIKAKTKHEAIKLAKIEFLKKITIVADSLSGADH